LKTKNGKKIPLKNFGFPLKTNGFVMN